MDLFRLSVAEQSNYVLKQVVIALGNYDICPHCHNYPKRDVLMSLIGRRPTSQTHYNIIISNLFVSCLGIFHYD